MFQPLAVVAALVASTVSAQAVGVNLTALAPPSIRVSSSTASDQSTLPAGAMANNGSLCAILPGAFNVRGCFTWVAYAQSYATTVGLTHVFGNPYMLPTVSGEAGPHEILVAFTSAVARTAKLHLNRSVTLSPGASWPTVDVDIDNDGVFEITNLSTQTGFPIPVSFGPQPLQIRVVIDVALDTPAPINNHVSLVLVPDNNLTITQPVTSCRVPSPPPRPFLQQSFETNGVELFVIQNPNEPSLMVLSLTTQPTLLSLHGTAPCILLPTADVVLFVPSGTFNMPLPASVRPATFYAQGVTLTPSGLSVTDGFAVTAN